MRLSELKKEIREEIISLLSEQTDDAKAAKAASVQKKKQGKDIEKNTKALSAYNDELEKSIDLEKDLTKAMMKEDEEEPSTTQLKGASKDSIAVIGVVIASIGIGLSSYYNSHVPDGVASIVIGLLIGVMAVILTLANARLLIDASIPQSDQEEIKEFIRSHGTIKSLVSMKTEILSPNRVRLSVEVEFDESQLIDEKAIANTHLAIEDETIENDKVLRDLSVKQIAMVARHVNKLEQQIFKKFPDIVTIDLEVK